MGEVEIWMSIPGYEGRYEFSNLHNIKSLKYGKERVLKQTIFKGYYQVGLYLNGKLNTFRIHQIVAMCHLGHVPDGYTLVVDHKNEIITDNRIENLQIITARENVSRSKKNCSSKSVGVSLCKTSKKWSSKIRINGKQIHLGLFDNEIEASQYYENALKDNLQGLSIKTKKRTNSSIYEGVSWYKKYEKWKSSICINKKQIHLGYFNNEIDAHNTYQAYKLKTPTQ